VTNRIGAEDPKKVKNVPGPGEYGAPDGKGVRKSSPSWRMGTSKRTELNQSVKVPGPGAYDPKVKVRTITHRIGLFTSHRYARKDKQRESA